MGNFCRKSLLLNKFSEQQIDSDTTVGHSFDWDILKYCMNFNSSNRGILRIRLGFIDKTIVYLINQLLFNLVRLLLIFIDGIIDLGVTILPFVWAIPPSMVDINPTTICTTIITLDVLTIFIIEYRDELDLISTAGAAIVQWGRWSRSTWYGGKAGGFIRFIEMHTSRYKGIMGFLGDLDDLVQVGDFANLRCNVLAKGVIKVMEIMPLQLVCLSRLT